MRLQLGDIVAIQQPVQLLDAERDHGLLTRARPVETVLFQALLPQAEAVGLPVEYLDTVTAAIAEHEQLLRERVKLQRLLGQYCEPVNALAEVNRVAMQVDLKVVITGAHHDSDAAAFKTALSDWPSTAPLKLTAVPLGSWTLHCVVGGEGATRTRANGAVVMDCNVTRWARSLRAVYIAFTLRPCACA